MTVPYCGYIGKRTTKNAPPRTWFMVKSSDHSGYVNLQNVSFPKHMVGKKLRFKIEVIEDATEKTFQYMPEATK